PPLAESGRRIALAGDRAGTRRLAGSRVALLIGSESTGGRRIRSTLPGLDRQTGLVQLRLIGLGRRASGLDSPRRDRALCLDTLSSAVLAGHSRGLIRAVGGRDDACASTGLIDRLVLIALGVDVGIDRSVTTVDSCLRVLGGRRLGVEVRRQSGAGASGQIPGRGSLVVGVRRRHLPVVVLVAAGSVSDVLGIDTRSFDLTLVAAFALTDITFRSRDVRCLLIAGDIVTAGT